MPTLKFDCFTCDGLTLCSNLDAVANSAPSGFNFGHYVATKAHRGLRLNLLYQRAPSVADLLLQRSNYRLSHKVGFLRLIIVGTFFFMSFPTLTTDVADFSIGWMFRSCTIFQVLIVIDPLVIVV